MDTKKIYFPNLNGLRFIAAALVIIHHIEQIKSLFKIPNYITNPFVSIIGKLGVILFFVLSGFLITYLLLAEEQLTQKISIKKFYLRRVFRIWPLYFFIIILAFALLPHIGIFNWPGYEKNVIYSNFTSKLLLFIFFLSNLALPLFGAVPYLSHTWSIGTEEQFYLIWPVLLKKIKKYRICLMFFIILFYLVVSFLLNTSLTNFIPYRNIIKGFWYHFNIDCMAIGALFAIVLFNQNKILNYLLNEWLFYVTILVTSFLLIKGMSIPYIHNEVYSVLFGIIILNFAANKKIKISLENSFLNYGGNISYGIYMYHPIGITLALYIASSIGYSSNWLLYPLSFALTIAISALSYKYLESFFLSYKQRFALIKKD